MKQHTQGHRWLVHVPAIVAALLIGASVIVPANAGASFIVYGCGHNLCRINPDRSGQTQSTNNGSATQPYHWPSLSRNGRAMSWLRANDVMLGDARGTASAGRAGIAPGGSHSPRAPISRIRPCRLTVGP